jgi:tetraacyldisaccharide 4'-kinase
LQAEKNVKLVYPDHHHFSEKDIVEIKNKANNKLIITTEKDYVRLKNQNFKSLFYLPIKSSFISKGDNFNQTILNYVGTSTANG